MKLQSVELQLPRAAAAAEFLEQTWRLIPCGSRQATTYLRGSGEHPYLLSLTEAQIPAIRSVTFSAEEEQIEQIQRRGRDAQLRSETIAVLDEPGGGRAVVLPGPEGQVFRFRSSPVAPVPERIGMGLTDVPVALTHVVLNTCDLSGCEAYAQRVLGFRVSDRTRIMTFLRCNQKHHSLAVAPAAVASLNHIAFEMHDLEAVMRGIGRLRDAGVECAWGPGRHGPGNNVFAYFIAPYGGVIEYTAEVSEVGDDYRIGRPEDWEWPPGRIDQWGISEKKVAQIAAAEKYFRFDAVGVQAT